MYGTLLGTVPFDSPSLILSPVSGQTNLKKSSSLNLLGGLTAAVAVAAAAASASAASVATVHLNEGETLDNQSPSSSSSHLLH